MGDVYTVVIFSWGVVSKQRKNNGGLVISVVGQMASIQIKGKEINQ